MPGASVRAPQILLAFDYGTHRIGVASGDTLTRTARALVTLKCAKGVPWQDIDRLVAEYQPAQLVVGVPYNMDGTPTALTKATRRFARELKDRYALPVALVDERLSSHEATAQLRDARAQGLKRRRITREDIDMNAARIVLERWFDAPDAAQPV
nr:Holliday junction resolvase RuvX [Gammaproteobacteria bacterium]